jgi:Na+(H+)/acetate symporter ActP
VGGIGLRLSRTTSDFYVASRAVRPVLNASAISGEYLSAASFLGIAGLILARGFDMLWYPVGWTAGYLMLLLFVAAPLRRSGAYTLPDFAEFRVESLDARRMASGLVVVIGVLYLVPQFQGAGLTLAALAGAPRWVGATLVGVVVLTNVVAGGMRSITIAQAFQYWLKLFALLFPMLLLLRLWAHQGSPTATLHYRDWVEPLTGPHALYLTYSLILATFLGTMGLPHVVVRFYTNPDGRAARRTTMIVLGLLSAFYLLPTLYGVLGRIYASDLVASGNADSVVLALPQRILGGTGGELLSALVGAGAFAAFLSTSSGLVVSVAGVISQDLMSRWHEGVRAFRLAGVLVVAVTLGLAAASAGLAVAHAVELAFAVAASTFCPLLVLGIWWRGLTAQGAIAGMLVGGLISGAAVVTAMVGVSEEGWSGAILAQPALVTVPVAFLVMVVFSLTDRDARPAHVASTMVRLHTPEAVVLDRGSYHPEQSRR